MVLGKPSVPGRPTYLGYSRPRVYCAGSMYKWGLFGHFSFICHFALWLHLSGRRPNIDWNIVSKGR